MWLSIRDTYLIKFVYLANEEVSVSTCYFGIGYVDHVLFET